MFGVPDYTMTETNEATDSDADIYEAVETDGAEVTVDPAVAGPSAGGQTPPGGYGGTAVWADRDQTTIEQAREQFGIETSPVEDADIDAEEIIEELTSSDNDNTSSGIEGPNFESSSPETSVTFDPDSIYDPFAYVRTDTDDTDE